MVMRRHVKNGNTRIRLQNAEPASLIVILTLQRNRILRPGSKRKNEKGTKTPHNLTVPMMNHLIVLFMALAVIAMRTLLFMTQTCTVNYIETTTSEVNIIVIMV